MKIADRLISSSERTYIIAEISGNHGNDFDQAMQLIRGAAEAGADAVKFQTFIALDIAAPSVKVPTGFDAIQDAKMKRLDVTTLRELFRYAGLPRMWHKELKKYAESQGVEFLSTPFSVDAAKFLVEEVKVPALKIASGDLTFTPLLEYAASTNLPIILSTGAANLAEITLAVSGPLLPAFRENRLAILHCVSVYPAPEHLLNLNVISMLRGTFLSVPIGWSDHSLSYDLVPALAVAKGASIIEKHIQLDQAACQSGPDMEHSIPVSQFASMVQTIRQTEDILGEAKKAPLYAEAHDRVWARRDPSDWLRPTQPGREGAWQ